MGVLKAPWSVPCPLEALMGLAEVGGPNGRSQAKGMASELQKHQLAQYDVPYSRDGKSKASAIVASAKQ